jgi:hypothetical protein
LYKTESPDDEKGSIYDTVTYGGFTHGLVEYDGESAKFGAIKRIILSL